MLIRYFASAAEAAGKESEQIDSSDLDAATLIDRIGAGNPRLEQILASSSLLADGVRIDRRDMPLRGVSQLDILPPFAGG